MKLGIIFGSSSNEHEVSVVSAASIIKNLDKEKYEIFPIYLDKKNEFYLWNEEIRNVKPNTIGILPTNLTKIEDPFKFLKDLDIVFLMVHGKNGEDGVLSSILEFLKIPFVGNKLAPSILTMDKILTKELLEKNGIKTTPYLAFSKYNNEYLYKDKIISKKELLELINNGLSYPLFVKPANSGSSIGITKVTKKEDLDKAISEALEVDHRILIEREVVGREVECGILERDKEVLTSVIGEVLASDEFYSFSAKYTNPDSKTIIPANIDNKQIKKIQDIARKAFQILDCHTYSRCDFFITSDNHIILNEINTIPGFTEISMYPKLFEASGISYQELLDILINESLNHGN